MEHPEPMGDCAGAVGGDSTPCEVTVETRYETPCFPEQVLPRGTFKNKGGHNGDVLSTTQTPVMERLLARDDLRRASWWHSEGPVHMSVSDVSHASPASHCM